MLNKSHPLQRRVLIISKQNNDFVDIRQPLSIAHLALAQWTHAQTVHDGRSVGYA